MNESESGSEMNQSPADANHRSRRGSSRREFQKFVNHAYAVIIACGILMWSVFNLSYNVLAYRNSEGELNWLATTITLTICCVIPLVVGVIVLFKGFFKKD